MENQYKVKEVIAFLEWVIINEMATEDEQVLYQNFKWSGQLERNYSYKKVLHKMKKLENEIF